MAKRKRKFHKIVIHPNRYLVWAVAVMLIVAASLTSYIYISSLGFDDLLNQPDVNYWHTYKTSEFSMRYPADWLIDSGIDYVGFGDKQSDKFLVYTYNPPNDPAYEAYAKLPSARHINIDGVLGIRVTDPNSTGSRIAFVKTSDTLYEFRGQTKYFDNIMDTVRFLKK